MEEDILYEFRNIVEESRTEDNRDYYIKLRDTLDFIENLLTRYKQQIVELEKKDKVINEIKFINDTNKPHIAQEKIKYYENKVEREGK